MSPQLPSFPQQWGAPCKMQWDPMTLLFYSKPSDGSPIRCGNHFSAEPSDLAYPAPSLILPFSHLSLTALAPTSAALGLMLTLEHPELSTSAPAHPSAGSVPLPHPQHHLLLFLSFSAQMSTAALHYTALSVSLSRIFFLIAFITTWQALYVSPASTVICPAPMLQWVKELDLPLSWSRS